MPNTRFAQALKDRQLTDLQRDVIWGCLLGDGTLSRSGKHYRLRVEQKAAHKEYVDWKFEKLRSICAAQPQFVPQHESWRFGTVGHPELSRWRREMYRNGAKDVPANWVDMVGPRSVAIWFMDDGNRIHNTVAISVHGFNRESLKRLAAILKRFGVLSRIHQDGHGPRLYIPTNEYSAFEKLVKAYVDEIPCMAYKLVQPRRDYTLAPVKAG